MTSRKIEIKPSADITLSAVVGGGYDEFWRSKKRYVVVKGSRASKKSKTTALWHIVNMMKQKDANTLVIRKTERTLRDSCYADLVWAIHRLHVDPWWRETTSPLELVYAPTGQKIIFRGLDDPLKIASISVPTGCICWCWIEEAYEITKEADFDTLDESIRGEMPDGLFKRITITFNPWSDKHWLKKRFFDRKSDDVLAMTTDYRCNEWLDDADLKIFEDLKVRNPRRYKVAGLGDWGVSEGLIYSDWEERAFPLDEIRECETCAGLDFGYTNDPSALFVGFLDKEKKLLYVWDEMYQKGMSNRKIADWIIQNRYGKERIVADSAEPKSIDELVGYGLRVKPARKGKDSVLNGIQWIQNLHMIVHPRCTSFLTELSNYAWDQDKFGNKLNVPIDEQNHLMDAMRYALESHIEKRGWII